MGMVWQMYYKGKGKQTVGPQKSKLKYHTDISIQTLYYDTWNLAQVSHISLEMFLHLDWSPPLGNSIDWT